MTLTDFAAALAEAYPNSHHYTAGRQTGNYVVWRELGGRQQRGGPLVIHLIQVDLFTRIELDPALSTILSALSRAGVAVAPPETMYEEDTGYIHHAISCEIADRWAGCGQ